MQSGTIDYYHFASILLCLKKMKNRSLLCVLILVAISLLSVDMLAQQDAFPGAEGFGRYASGGRCGDVYHVTNLNDDGAGSLRYGIEHASGPRTIVFDISGNIQLTSRLSVKKPNITIAGQTAPGDGITLGGHAFYIDADHIIVRYIRCRFGDISGAQYDAISITGGSHIILDHVTASWSVDETLSCQSEDVDSLTVQWCLISESLRYSIHDKGAHGYGGIIGAKRQSFHHNLYAHHSSRSPKVTGRRHCEVDFRNNVIYNWVYNNCYDGTASYLNWANNYYKAGPATDQDVRKRIFELSDEDIAPGDSPEDSKNFETSLYAEGNYVRGFPGITANNWSGGIDFDKGATEGKNRARSPFDFPSITQQTALSAYPLVVARAGASLVRDSLDRRIAHDVETGTADFGSSGIIDSQTDVGGWPALQTLPAPLDTDQDGMPDEWETARGLNPNDPADRNGDDNANGYTNLEEYLNELVKDEYPPQYPGEPAIAYLTVEGGLGTGEYTAGTGVNIVAPAPEPPLKFEGWQGDTAYISDVDALSTTVIMPGQNVAVSASYQAYYTLKVYFGDGDGDYMEGDTVTIEADPPGNDQVFDRWTGDTLFVHDVEASSTSLTMPAGNLYLTATYADLVSAQGSSAGQVFYCYPNPAHADFSINLVNTGDSSIDICNLLGQSIYRAHSAESEYLVQDHQLSSGIYVIRVKDGKGEVHTQKLIIQ